MFYRIAILRVFFTLGFSTFLNEIGQNRKRPSSNLRFRLAPKADQRRAVTRFALRPIAH
jgi:hypothetical protein